MKPTTDHSPAYQVGQINPLQDFLEEGLFRSSHALSRSSCCVPFSKVCTHVTILQDTPPPQSRVQFCHGPTRHLCRKFFINRINYFQSSIHKNEFNLAEGFLLTTKMQSVGIVKNLFFYTRAH